MLALSVAVAVGQDAPTYDDLSTLSEDPVLGEAVPDTDYTPEYQGKDASKTWLQKEGALFRDAGNEDKAESTVGLATSYDDNLFDVSFRNEKRGFAGGATCDNPDPDIVTLQQADAASPKANCRPVLYEFRNSPATGPGWSKVALPGADEPGFVGAIAWIDGRRAMVVGGTGIYPRREPAYDPECQSDDPLGPWGAECDPAGMARVWLYDGGDWCELRVEEPNGACPELPADDPATARFEGMRGLTAVDFNPNVDPELGFVGGLGQIWRFQGGRFDQRIDNHSSPDDLSQPTSADTRTGGEGRPDSGLATLGNPFAAAQGGALKPRPRMQRRFRSRVRDLRFFPASTTPRWLLGPDNTYVKRPDGKEAEYKAGAYAVTSGCCAPTEESDLPSVLAYRRWIRSDGSAGSPGQPSPWSLTEGSADRDAIDELSELGRDPGTEVGSETVPTPGVPSLRELGVPLPKPPTQSGLKRQFVPSGLDTPKALDSYYSLTTSTPLGENPAPLARVASAGSSESRPEERSTVTGGCRASAGRGVARLVAIDGPTPTVSGCKHGPDWAVGELRTAIEPGRGRRGLVLSADTPERARPTPYYAPPPATPEGAREALEDGYMPTDEERMRQAYRSREQLVTSYSLNSLDMVDDTGVGWAVGDHGAILQLDSAGEAEKALFAEPEPARLDPASTRELAASEPFDALRPVAASRPGQVPPLGARPLERLTEPRLVSAGSPDATHPRPGDQIEDVSDIVMSRDGSEGWAVGTNPMIADPTKGKASSFYGSPSLYHYDGVSWTRCDPKGVAAELAADPECAGLAPLTGWLRPGAPPGTAVARTTLIAAARIPYERDDEPANDDEFEAVAIGGQYWHGQDPWRLPALARLKNGRWELDLGMHDLLAKRHTGSAYDIEFVDVAFTAPDDGWVLGRQGEQGKQVNLLFHWDGEGWSLCEGACFRRVPLAREGAVLGLEAAGDRVYMYGWRQIHPGTNTDQFTDLLFSPPAHPLIIYRDRRKGVWTDGSGAGEGGGGFDPGFENPTAQDQGKVVALSVAERPDGGYTGWAIGRYFNHPPQPLDRFSVAGGVLGYDDQHNQGTGGGFEPTTIALRLEEANGRGTWRYFKDPGALNDFMGPALQRFNNERLQTEPRVMTTLGDGRAFIAQRHSGILFGFERDRGRFEVVPGQRPGWEPGHGGNPQSPVLVNGQFQALAADGQGGFWAAVKNERNPFFQREGESGWPTGGQVYFFHYTDRPREPVFREVPHPLGGGPERFTALAGSASGTLWAAIESGQLARYDRLTGWERVPIAGWDPGPVVTRRSEVFALAVNDDGLGVAVGPKGRIADISPTEVRIDRAAGVRCAAQPEPPCGTGYDLHAAAVAPDGSTLVGGDALTVLWRPARGEFQRVARPPGPLSSRITEISYPSPDRAYLVTDAGYAYTGELTAAGWSWRFDNVDAEGDPVKVGAVGAIAVAAGGDGYAVGDGGLLLERTNAGGGSWKPLRGPGTDDLRSVALGRDGEGALIGGEGGVIWTRAGDRFEIARPADYSRQHGDRFSDRGLTGGMTGAIVGVALMPGVKDGQVEAWAASEARGQGTNRIFHYSSDPDEPLLEPDTRAEPLPDTPAAREGELAFATFGNSDCDLRAMCAARRGTLTRHEVIGERIVAALREAHGRPGAPDFTLFTGDATFTAGLPASSTHRSDRVGSTGNYNLQSSNPTTDPYGRPEMALAPVMQRQWNRMIADPLEDAGLPVYATPGPGDLSRPLYQCTSASRWGCVAVGEEAKSGDNLSWRDAMAARAAPWGTGASTSDPGELSFEAVPGSADGSQEVTERRVDPDGTGPFPETKVGGGARTHYAVDVKRGGEAAARIVAVDTSLRSLQGSDPVQQPVEPDGQLRWLERMLCREGETPTGGGNCTRGADQPVIVLTSTPTYSYGATSPTEINAADGAQLESLLIEYDASVVVTGRLGWNARYWATAPGVHVPCPGGPYQDAPPAPGTRVCDNAQTEEATGELSAGAEAVAQTLSGLGAASPELPGPVAKLADPAVGDGTGLLPFVIAGGGGGPLGTSDLEEPQQAASGGYWNGYTVVRVPRDGDPAEVIVEQRPILDWVNVSAQTHVLRPGQKMTLRGVGREPVGYGAKVTTRFDELNTQAITHRYDLVMADPEKPYIPLEDANGDYVPVPAQVATLDRTTGALRAGKGRGERTYAIAILSVGEKAATWPIAFEPRRSFVAQRAKLTLPAIPRAARAPAAQQPIRLSDAPPPPPPPPATPPGSPLTTQSLQAPAPPELPSLPTINAAAPPPAPSLNAPPPPPPPPAPPPAPPQQQPLPLNVSAKVQAVSIVPSVNPPAPPPVNPAPPGGAAARKEAKQKQAAVAKSEEGDSVGAETQGLGGDKAESPLSPQGSEMTRHQPLEATRRAADRPTGSFSPIVRPDPASAWSRGALYGGGLGLATLALVLGFSVLRPRPRRRPPEVPAPAWNRVRRG